VIIVHFALKFSNHLKSGFIIWQQNNHRVSATAAAIQKISIFNQKTSEKCFDTVGQMPGWHPTHLQKTHITYTQRLCSVIITHRNTPAWKWSGYILKGIDNK